ncbi:glycosyltransferase [Phycicoccus flavus]|uniref:glycosyltransferase n=1 Tax=Phycicoccus flavus TaxID=2502783 RepID=UPI000FEB9D4F|nr:glycosyltransferase [Phycicoccus flavus]NHA66682.1 glycosyltransferase family 1 protein [Phycicoccus flavus]
MGPRPRLLVTGMTANPGGKESFILSAFTALADDFEWVFLADRPNLAHADRITAMGGRIVTIRPRSQSPLGNRRDLRALYDEVDFAAVWSHQTVLNTLAPLSLARRAGVPVRIIHSHSTRNMGTWVAAVLHPVNRRLLRFAANRRFACSAVAARWFYGGGPYRLVPNIFDVEDFTFDPRVRAQQRAALGLGERTLALVHVARFGIEKNHEHGVRLVAALTARGRDAVLLLVGDGERRPEIEAEARRLGVEDRVRLLGLRSDVPRVLQAADLMILPSRFEGLPYTVLEGQAAGLPCLVSDRVSPDVDAGGTVRFAPLESSADAWGDLVDGLVAGHERPAGANPLRGGPYDAAAGREQLLAAIAGPWATP